MLPTIKDADDRLQNSNWLRQYDRVQALADATKQTDDASYMTGMLSMKADKIL